MIKIILMIEIQLTTTKSPKYSNVQWATQPQ